jgi:plastocyanin
MLKMRSRLHLYRGKPLRALAAVAALAALAGFAVPALAAHTRTIKVGDFFFVKDSNHTPTVHVAKGTVVRWKFTGLEAHNVTVIKGPAKFHSRDMDRGVFKHRVFKPGTYLIECTIHGFKMRLVVGKPKPAPAPQTSPTPTGPTPAPPPTEPQLPPNPYPTY